MNYLVKYFTRLIVNRAESTTVNLEKDLKLNKIFRQNIQAQYIS